MGLYYSLCAIQKRRDSGLLLGNLATLLDEHSRARIGNLKWNPVTETRRITKIGTTEVDARGIAGLQLEGHEHKNSYCFSLEVQLEQEMEVILGDHQFDCFRSRGSFGCMWSSILAGSKYLLISMTAATTGMSRVVQCSNIIHESWKKFAQSINAIIAYIDIEDSTGNQIYPTFGDVLLPDTDTLSFHSDYHYSVDLAAEFIIYSNID